MQSFLTGNSNQPMSLEEAVWADPGRMSGTPCFRGTRVPIQHLFDWLADGVELDQFLEDFEVDPRAAEAVLREGCLAVCTAASRNPDCTSSS